MNEACFQCFCEPLYTPHFTLVLKLLTIKLPIEGPLQHQSTLFFSLYNAFHHNCSILTPSPTHDHFKQDSEIFVVIQAVTPSCGCVKVAVKLLKHVKTSCF